MRILVTGGAGYIGSHVVALLAEQNHEILTLDNLSTGSKRLVIGGEFVQADVADTQRLEKLFNQYRFDAVMHFAASISVEESLSDPELYYENNVCNTLKLIHQCARHGVKSFVFSSTAAVYGAPAVEWIDESCTPVPINPYGASKLAAERLVADVCQASSLPYVSLRYFNVAGADPALRIGQMYKKATHLMTVACKVASGQLSQLTIFGSDYPTPDGTCVRDYIHVCDIAQAHVCALQYLHRGGASTTVNCGYGHGFSVREVVAMVQRVTQVDFAVVEGARRAMDSDPPRLVANNQKIQQVLGWVPAKDRLEDIVKTAWAWEQKLNQRQ